MIYLVMYLIVITFYSCIRFGIACVYADRGDKMDPGWTIFDNIIFFIASVSSVLALIPSSK